MPVYVFQKVNIVVFIFIVLVTFPLSAKPEINRDAYINYFKKLYNIYPDRKVIKIDKKEIIIRIYLHDHSIKNAFSEVIKKFFFDVRSTNANIVVNNNLDPDILIAVSDDLDSLSKKTWKKQAKFVIGEASEEKFIKNINSKKKYFKTCFMFMKIYKNEIQKSIVFINSNQTKKEIMSCLYVNLLQSLGFSKIMNKKTGFKTNLNKHDKLDYLTEFDKGVINIIYSKKIISGVSIIYLEDMIKSGFVHE